MYIDYERDVKLIDKCLKLFSYSIIHSFTHRVNITRIIVAIMFVRNN